MSTQTQKEPPRIREALDHYEGTKVTWPPLGPITMKHDFLIRKTDGGWRYLNSADDPARFGKCKKAVVAGGGFYAILESKTGQVVESNDPEFQ